MELLHTNRKWLGNLRRWMITYEDDASKHVMGYATTLRTDSPVLHKGPGGGHIQVRHAWSGTHRPRVGVLPLRLRRGAKGPLTFSRHLEERVKRHIVGRVNRTNGKVERLFGTVKEKLPRFDCDFDILFH